MIWECHRGVRRLRHDVDVICDLTASHVSVAGIALDLVGAGLLGRGLLATVQQLALSSTWGALGHSASVRRAEDRVDASFGTALIGLGFTAQGGSYILDSAGWVGEGGRASTLIWIVVAAIALPLAGYLTTRKWMLRRLVHRTAWARPIVDNPKPIEDDLASYAVALGYEPNDDEADDTARFARRVFGAKALDRPPRVTPAQTRELPTKGNS